MIVGVEPFGHLHRRRVGGMGAAGMGMAGLRAAGHGEIEVGADRLAAPVIAGRDGADQGGGVEDMVVEREVVRRQDVGTERLLPRPVGDAPAGGGGLGSDEHTSELQSLMRNSYAVFCLKKQKKPSDNQKL